MKTVQTFPVKVFKTKEYAQLPEVATVGSACFDVRAAFVAGDRVKCYNAWNKQVDVAVKIIGGKVAFQIPPEHRVMVPTGLIFDVPEGFVMKMYVRSSVALKKGLVLVNGVGVIDSDYVEESYILLHNISDSLVVIENGERLAQCELVKSSYYKIEEIDKAPAQKTDRAGGMGSTGTN
jgi:dUTPase